MKNNITRTGIPCVAFALVAVLLALFAGSLMAQNPYPDYDFKAANADGDTLYYRITSATAPYTVAVTRCHDSVYHTLPDPQTSIEVGQPGFLYPVYDYDSLITIPSSVTYQGQTYTVNAIDKEAFYMQKDMHTVVLPASIVTIDSGAFYRSTLHQIVMSPNVTRINFYAFESTPLESIDLPSGLTHIGKEAFAWTSISEVEIPSGVTLLPQNAFFKSPLTKIVFHEGLQEIEQGAFSANYIDTLVFPRSLRKIALGDYFSGSSDPNEYIACQYVEFQTGENPLELADFCFKGFNHLETLILSDNIVRLGESCFEQTSIPSVVIPPLVDTIHYGCFMGCPSLANVTMPQQLTCIDQHAFGATPSLTQIAIPASVTSIGKGAFATASGGLRVLDIYCEIPPAINGGNAAPSFSKQDTIYVRVPCGKIATYQSAPGWSSYSNLVYDECVGVEEQEPSAFKVYPNPVENIVFVELRGAEIASVALYDLQGRVVTDVCDTPLQKTTTTLNMKSVPSGVYVLRVTDTNGREHQSKIVKRQP